MTRSLDELFKIQSLDQVCEIQGIDLADEIPFPNAKSNRQVAANAFVKLCIVAEFFNQGWRPNWTDQSEPKYFPLFDLNPPAAPDVPMTAEEIDALIERNANGFVEPEQKPISYIRYISSNGHYCEYSDSETGSYMAFQLAEVADYVGQVFLHLFYDYMTYEW